MSQTEFVPDPSKVAINERFSLDREGVHKTLFFSSYSGGFLISEPLPTLVAEINGYTVEISPPVRLGQASHRPTPQFRLENVEKFFNFETFPPQFPLQVATFPTLNKNGQASFDLWFGPTEDVKEKGPQLPADTLVITIFGKDSQNQFELAYKYFVEPLLLWLRTYTDQWWLGRSVEGVTKPLHFVVPLDANNSMQGSPTPVIQFTAASEKMLPITAKMWTDAADAGLGRKLPDAHATLESDAKYMLASSEFRSAIILACCSIEANRDRILANHDIRVSRLGGSGTDLLKHLSTGFEKKFDRNLKTENEPLYEKLRALWLARGAAAHGKDIFWRESDVEVPIENKTFGEITSALHQLNEWVATI